MAESPLEAALSHSLLSKFQVHGYPGFYSLSAHPELRSISINSQIRLATEFVVAAQQIGLISESRPLLIVGAGAAGVAAAMIADRLKIPVRLRETKEQPFSLQAHCPTRWLHPHQYDWPQAWFAESRFPHLNYGVPIALSWEAASAREVAGQWDQQFQAFKKTAQNFDQWFAAPPFSEAANAKSLVEECDINLRTNQPEHFAVYLFCRGFACEDVTVGAYSGYRFWDEDPFEKPFAGVKNAAPNVVISGAGDGGLQDFIRFVFGSRRPIFVVQQVAEEMNMDEQHAKIWTEFCSSLLAFSPDPRSGPRVSEMHDICGRFVENLDAGMIERLSQRLAPYVVIDFSTASVRLICAKASLPSAFALNVLIVRLVEKLIETHHPRRFPVIRRSTKLSHPIGRNGHVCQRLASACHGVSHDAQLNDDHVEFNVLVVRHGLDDEERALEMLAGQPTGN